MADRKKIEAWLVVACVLLSLGILVVDTQVELGVAGGVPYVAVILLSLRLRHDRWTFLFAVTCTLFTWTGFYLSPWGGELWKIVTNRALATFAIWITTLLGLRLQRANLQLRESRDRLEEQVSGRTAELRATNQRLNEQIDRHREAQAALLASEDSYRHLFARMPVSIWVEDFSAVGQWLQGLRDDGVTDLRTYLANHPGDVACALAMIRVRDVNDAAVEVFEAANKEELLAGLPKIFEENSCGPLIEELVAIWEGRDRIEHEADGLTLRGRRFHKIVHWAAPRVNGRLDLTHVLVAVSDITPLKRAHATLQENNTYLRLLQAVAAAANEATELDDALQVALDEICARTGWPVGHAYLASSDDADLLIPTELWHLDDPQRFKVFREVTEATNFQKGQGLPGRVLASGKPAWIVDVNHDPNFPRAKLAEDIGVHGAFGFPVLVGHEVVAVLEFFAATPAPPDQRVLEIMAYVGTLLGRVMERSRARSALRESERLYRSTFDHAAVGISNIDLEGRFIRVNPALCQMLGYPAQELTRLRLRDITAAEDMEYALENRRRLITGQVQVLRTEKRFTRKDGTLMWAGHTIRSILSADGSISHFVSIIEDITDRKQAQHQLEDLIERERAANNKAQESQRQICDIIERVSDAFVALDKDWRYTYVNEKAGQIFNRRPQDLVGKNIWEEFPEGVGQPFHLAYEEAVNTQEMVEIEEYYPPWDLWFENRIYPSVNGVSIFFRDITERKKNQARIQKTEAFNRLLIDTVPCGIAHIARDGAVLHVNAEAQRLLGFTYDEITQKYVSDWRGNTVWEDGSPCPVEEYPITKCLETGQPQPAATVGIFTPEGKLRWSVFTAVPFLDPESQEPGSAILAFVDVTQRKKNEEERQKLEEDLREAKRLEDAGTLSSGAAHDFNHWLGTIQNFAQVAYKKLDHGHPALEPLTMIDRVTHQAQQVTDSLLTFARQKRTDKAPVNLVELLTDTIRLIRKLVPASIKAVLHVEHQAIWIMGNRAELEQMIINLANNARDAMPLGGELTISVGLAPPDPDFPMKDRAVMTVIDTGQGIPKKILSRIFEPFFTTKQRHKGTGLGLAVVHGVVTDHQGHIEAVSQPGRGTCFLIQLPTCQAPVELPEPLPSGASSAQPRLILLTEDQQYELEIMASTLEEAGHEVIATTEPSEMLEYAQRYESRIGLIILGINDPEKETAGPDTPLLERLVTGYPRTPVLVTNGAALSPGAGSNGTIHTLAKPFQMSRFQETVEYCIRSQ